MARAKSTGRAEARRRYRQAATEPVTEDGSSIDYGERRPDASATTPKGRPAQRDATPSGRPGFASAFRAAYHPPNVREDIRTLPSTLRSRAFLGAIGMIAAGALIYLVLPGYDGTAFAFQLIILPGSALAPQLVAGFFAPRASYLLGLIVGIIQGLAFLGVVSVLAAREGVPMTQDVLTSYLQASFITGPISSMLFAAAAAWYRRFLALSSPRRPPAGRNQAKGGTSKSAARR